MGDDREVPNNFVKTTDERVTPVGVVEKLKNKLDGFLMTGLDSEERKKQLKDKLGIDECLRVRDELKGKSPDVQRERLNGDLWLVNERDRLMGDEFRLDQNDVANLEKLNTALRERSELSYMILERLLNVNELLVGSLEVEDPQNNIEHIVRVASRADKDGGPIEGILGALHDVVKLISLDGKDAVLLAEHETLSARAATMILSECEEVFDDIGGEGCGKSLVKLATKSFYHGKKEYPELMTVKGGISQITSDGFVEKGILFGGIYAGSPDLGKINLGEGLGGKPAEMLNNLRAADMLDGCTGLSLLKYLEYYPANTIVAENKLHDFVTKNLFASLETNLAFAPDCPVKDKFVASDDYLKVLMIYALLSDDPSVGEEMGDRLKEITGSAAVSEEAEKDGLAPYQVNISYLELLTGFEGMVAQRDQQIAVDKSHFVTEFGKFVNLIRKLDIGSIPNLKEFLSGSCRQKMESRLQLIRQVS